MFVRFFAFVGFLVVLAGAPQLSAAQEQVTVFAAASLKNALDDTNAAFTKATGVKVTVSYAASSALAKQIEQEVQQREKKADEIFNQGRQP